ncbi:MAG: hypothetical protein GF408_04615 [Candidatus Omnitrophica bacterium]|nr:hypothetical protein [Candidatus Omnitrophota bacterium]
MRRTLILSGIIVSLFSGAFSEAYEFRGYTWGQSLERTRRRLERRDEIVSYNKESSTLVYSGFFYGEECKVSLLFTPESGELAGIALVWADDTAKDNILADLSRKYGEPLKPGMKARDVEYYLWKSPTDPNDRIALIIDPKAMVLGYYGGDFYEKYRQEAGEE